MGLKKRGFAKGKWNGFGGKIEPNENVTQSALRELKEEAGITTENIQFFALMKFTINKDNTIWFVHLYISDNF